MQIELYRSRWRIIGFLILFSVFVALGIFIIIVEGSDWRGWLCIGFFGLGIPISLRSLFDRRPQIIINEIGIFDRTAYTDFINWEVIWNAYPVSVHRQKFICLVIDPTYEPSWRKGLFRRSLSRINKEVGMQELNINLSLIKVDALKLTLFINELIKAQPAGRRERLAQGMLK